MNQKRCALMLLVSLLMTSTPLLAVDSEALGEELKKGQNRAETQKPTPQKQADEELAHTSKQGKTK